MPDNLSFPRETASASTASKAKTRQMAKKKEREVAGSDLDISKVSGEKTHFKHSNAA